MRQSDRHQQVATVIVSLKQLCRMRGLRYREIAALLDVTERTVKRWFAGSGLTLQIVEDLCNVLGVTFMELCEVARDDLDTRPRRLGREQERLLFADLQLAFVFILLNRGWSAQEIQRDCRMPEALLVEHLVRLERLRLVELLPGNKVRLLFARNIRWHDGAEAGKAFAREFQKLFVKMDFSTPDAIWSTQVVSISAQALNEVQAKMQSFTLEIVKNADSEKGSLNSKSWHVVMMAVQHFDPLKLERGIPRGNVVI